MDTNERVRAGIIEGYEDNLECSIDFFSREAEFLAKSLRKMQVELDRLLQLREGAELTTEELQRHQTRSFPRGYFFHEYKSKRDIEINIKKS